MTRWRNYNVSRRNFLKTVGVVSAGSILAACAPAGEMPQQQEGGGDGEPAAATLGAPWPWGCSAR